jgi:hypothetical protein
MRRRKRRLPWELVVGVFLVALPLGLVLTISGSARGIADNWPLRDAIMAIGGGTVFILISLVGEFAKNPKAWRTFYCVLGCFLVLFGFAVVSIRLALALET